MASSTRMRSGERTAASCTESVTTCMAGEVSIRQINLSNKQKKKPGSRARPFLLAVAEKQQAEARHVKRVDEHAAAPVAPSAHRLHFGAIDVHPRVLVAVPA